MWKFFGKHLLAACQNINNKHLTPAFDGQSNPAANSHDRRFLMLEKFFPII